MVFLFSYFKKYQKIVPLHHQVKVPTEQLGI